MWLQPRQLNQLLVVPERNDASGLLKEWRWLVPPDYEVIGITALGDAFLRAADGSVHRLDTGSAELDRVASDVASFELLLGDPGRADVWLVPDLVTALHESGLVTKPGECYSLKIPPTLGGAYELSNYEVLSWGSHFRSMAKIQAQVRDVPIGTAFTRVDRERE